MRFIKIALLLAEVTNPSCLHLSVSCFFVIFSSESSTAASEFLDDRGITDPLSGSKYSRGGGNSTCKSQNKTIKRESRV